MRALPFQGARRDEDWRVGGSRKTGGIRPGRGRRTPGIPRPELEAAGAATPGRRGHLITAQIPLCMQNRSTSSNTFLTAPRRLCADHTDNPAVHECLDAPLAAGAQEFQRISVSII